MALFNKYPWHRIIPDPESHIIIEGKGEIAHNSMAVAASDQKHEFIVVYIPSRRRLKVDASLIKSNRVKASWFDPRTGKYSTISTNAESRIGTFESPDERDWVLVLESN